MKGKLAFSLFVSAVPLVAKKSFVFSCLLRLIAANPFLGGVNKGWHGNRVRGNPVGFDLVNSMPCDLTKRNSAQRVI